MNNIGKWLSLILLFCLISCASPPEWQPAPFNPYEYTPPALSFNESMDHIAGAIVATMQEHGWERVVIGDFKANAGNDTSLENSIVDAITKNIGSVKGVTVVEKADSDRVLKFLKTTFYEIAHPISDSTFSIGKALKKYGDKTYADIILGGTFSTRDGIIYLVSYFVETKTGRIYQQKFDGIAKSYNISQDRKPQTGYVSQGGFTWMPEQGTWYNYAEATALCRGTINGQTGWRLPTKDELVSLYYSGAMNGQGWTLSFVWSSTPAGAGIHYGVNMFTGFATANKLIPDTMAGGHVTCVR